MQNSKTNSPNSPEQPPDTAQNADISTRTMAKKPAARKIDATIIAEIARLVARQLTESEACRQLGIEPRQWFDWKSRASRSERFAGLLEAHRANRIDDLIKKIEAGADGVGMKQPDWRAAAFLLSVTDKKRFGPQAEAAPSPQLAGQVSEATLLKVLSMLKAERAKPVIDIPASEPKQITDAGTKPPKE